jgi:hypothetical protein
MKAKDTKKNAVTTGAIWKLFYADKAAWPDDSYHDDTQLKINGKEQDPDIDYDNLADDAAIEILSGYVVFPDGSDMDLGKHFKNWLAKQNGNEVVLSSFQVPRSKLESVRKAIIDAGGKLL